MISVVDETLDVLQYRVALIAGLAQGRVGFGAQQYTVRTVDADEAQLVQGFRDRLRDRHAPRQGSVTTGLLVPWPMPSMPAAA